MGVGEQLDDLRPFDAQDFAALSSTTCHNGQVTSGRPRAALRVHRIAEMRTRLERMCDESVAGVVEPSLARHGGRHDFIEGGQVALARATRRRERPRRALRVEPFVDVGSDGGRDERTEPDLGAQTVDVWLRCPASINGTE